MYGIYFPRVVALHLGKNKIENYCFPPRHFAPQLSKLFLQNNKLSEIQFSHVASHCQQVEIFLDGNPWHCNNTLGWAEQCVLTVDSNMYCMGSLTLRGMICTSPLVVQGLTPNEAGGDICRIKTGHSNLVSRFGPRMRALAKVFYRGESRGKIPCQRPNPKAKT